MQASCSPSPWVAFPVAQGTTDVTDLAFEDIESRAEIDVRVIRPNATFTVPVVLEPRYKPHHPPKTVFDVWDEYTSATQPGGRGQLAVAELSPTDSLSVEPHSDGYRSSDYFELEFFQVEVYYAIAPTRK